MAPSFEVESRVPTLYVATGRRFHWLALDLARPHAV